MKAPRLAPALAFALAVASLPPADAAVKLPPLFSEHAVLQRGMAVPDLGTADPGEEVTVSFAGQIQSAKAGADGKWKITLQPLKEAESLAMTVKGTNTLEVKDIAVGEVWVNSGQSNMSFTLNRDSNAQAAIAASEDPQLRLFTVPFNSSDIPLAETVGSKWIRATPATTPTFSAVGYYFARELRKALKVPVGLLSTSVGGTPAEAWTSHDALTADPRLKSVFEQQESAVKIWPAALEKYQQNEARLLEQWQANVEKAKAAGKPAPRKPSPPPDPTKDKNRPSGLYNAMVAPLQPYAIRGAIWYQGESNNPRANLYHVLFSDLIADWRRGWGADFPFFFVQIAPHNGMTPEIREAQLLTTQTVPHTAMAVITDYGTPPDIHPPYKEPVGTRLSLAARALAYGEKIEYSGPTFDSMKIEGANAVLKFQHAGGLTAKDGELKGFTLAGEDKKFVPAKAEIKGDTVTVSAEPVAKPVAVRYGWANVPDVNFYNGAGLPASPFRTDVEK